jgi:cobalt/nickel transport system permease protein
LRKLIDNIYELERLSGKTTPIHKLRPITKLITALVFIATVVSFNNRETLRLAPYFFYPAVLMSIAEIPPGEIVKRFLIAAPFCLLAGLDIYALAAAGAKTFLCVSAVLILAASTPFAELTATLRGLKIPGVFVTVFELLYRYAGAILEEAYSTFLAYKLRAPKNAKGVAMRDMGTFAGRLLIKSFDRAERVYIAMKLRGYGAAEFARDVEKPALKDYFFCLFICAYCVFFRLINLYK